MEVEIHTQLTELCTLQGEVCLDKVYLLVLLRKAVCGLAA